MGLLKSLLFVLVLPAANAQETAFVDPPADFPYLSFNINPIYHATGVRLGHVLSIRRERPLLYTYEGEIMLGFGTNPHAVVDRQCIQSVLPPTNRRSANQQVQDENRRRANKECFLFNNPVRFSTLKTSVFNNIVETKDRPVLIYYINHHFAPSHILMKTDTKVLQVFPVIPNLKIDPSYQIPAWSKLHPEAGVITGRIVQASLEFSVRKTYELIIQESENADNFRSMSVSDGKMFRYIMHAMLTGKLLRIQYIRLYRPHSAFLSSLFNYLTDFRVISVEIVADSSPP